MMMYRFVIKIAKYVFLGILPFILNSNSGDKNDEGLVHVINEDLIPPQLDFGLATEESDAGILFKTLTLVFSDTMKEDQGRIELVLKIKNNDERWYKGEYKVGKVDGFLNGFEGIFGYFTHKDFGEKPFFADSGTVKILSLEDNRIQGYMDVTLVNDYGRTIRISDTFRNY